MPTQSDMGDIDVLIVGAGFSGVYMLTHLRRLGCSVKVFESGSDLGGVWRWNCYPGARVDTVVPLYEFSMEELWKDWTWKEKFPGFAELREYFQHVDMKLAVKKDIRFNTRVTSAHWNVNTDRWDVQTESGATASPRFLILCTGFVAKFYVPPFRGIENFQGIVRHTSQWPDEGLSFEGKKVAVVGTGASGVQVIQEIGPVVKHLTVFQRTPNFATPMRQTTLDRETQQAKKKLYPTIFKRRLQTLVGLDYNPFPQDFFSATPEERDLHMEEQWNKGGFHFLIGNYQDVWVNEKANAEVYRFWRDRTRARLHDPRLQELLAPTTAPHPFGAKRLSLEQAYYEVFNQSNVRLVDTNESPIVEITANGIETSDGVHHEVDVIVLATGFDSVTGGITQIDIRGVDGSTIKEKWSNGVHTHLGMTTANFPNMFFLYGPQAPTALSNGPTCVEIQGDWITACIEHLLIKGLTRIEATREAEKIWRDMVMHNSSMALFDKAKGWYNGANIPGKHVEQLNFVGGVSLYADLCREKAEKGYQGFVLSSIGEADVVKVNGM
ncbi:hypothetical protein PM082_017882 [Marasmius tenuissimus]|nr:hypothetical protein PM082_017882 [Marasmius tenuissimus]